MASVLIVYGSTNGQTALIADAIAHELRERDLIVEVEDVEALPEALDVAAFDAIVVGGRVHGSGHPRKLVAWVRHNLHLLQRVPSAFFSVSLVAARKDGTGRQQAQAIVDRFIDESGWSPLYTAIFAGACKYTQYNFVLRWIMKQIARAEGGETDTSRDWEYTDWSEVHRFGAHLARDLGAVEWRPAGREAAGVDAEC